MPDIEMVKEGLKTCCNDRMRCEGKCPYESIKRFPQCMNTLMKDALKLLKEQQPRVLTIDETINAKYPMDVFAEVKEEDRFFAVTAPIIKDWAFDPNIRFWTARPTEEQRKAVPWE